MNLINYFNYENLDTQNLKKYIKFDYEADNKIKGKIENLDIKFIATAKSFSFDTNALSQMKTEIDNALRKQNINVQNSEISLEGYVINYKVKYANFEIENNNYDFAQVITAIANAIITALKTIAKTILNIAKAIFNFLKKLAVKIAMIVKDLFNKAYNYSKSGEITQDGEFKIDDESSDTSNAISKAKNLISNYTIILVFVAVIVLAYIFTRK
ncbi:MAG: hypothetical protein ACO2O6_01305 [Candidatus Hydrothermia bacterium]|jgi:hypothetical protein